MAEKTTSKAIYTPTSNADPTAEPGQEGKPRFLWIALSLLAAALIWGYWSSLLEASEYWQKAQYSHGWLVPLFTAVLLWMRYRPLTDISNQQRWWGVGLLMLALLGRLLSGYYGFEVPDMWTFVPAAAGVVLLAGGWSMFRWAGPAVVFLFFMFPLPWTLEAALLNPLQNLATQMSTYALQTLGFEAYREGNRICIEDLTMGVVDACSGLRMTTIFVALSVAIVLVAERHWWENLVILVSAIPIALTVNVARITVTGVLHVTVGTELANKVFHDLAGWVMMPLAMAILGFELLILSHLFYEVEVESPIPMVRRR